MLLSICDEIQVHKHVNTCCRWVAGGGEDDDDAGCLCGMLLPAVAGAKWVLGYSILYFIGLHCVTPANVGTNYLFSLTEIMIIWVVDGFKLFAQGSSFKLFRFEHLTLGMWKYIFPRTLQIAFTNI